ncbi:MAG: FAD-dependent oxidoreductase [Planctomycetota bacterium]
MTGFERIVIIGAGPAGSAAAGFLARARCEVVVVEPKTFPRVKVCGEFVSPAATDVLESLIPPIELVALGGRRVRELVLERGGEERVFDMPTPAWALSRATLDEALAERAVESGATYRFGVGVKRIDWSDGDRHAGIVELTDGSTLGAHSVIHADGSGRFDPAGATKKIRGVVGHKCHLHVPGGVDGIRMRGATDASRGSYVGLIGVERGLATCALVAGKQHIVRHRGDADSMLRALWPGYDPAWREGPWLSCGVARSPYVRPGHPCSLRIGNAAAAVDPVGGEGIGLALWSGRETARSLLACSTVAGAEQMLRQAYRRRLRTRAPACRWAAEVMMRPRAFAAAWNVLQLPGVSIEPWYRLTGKPSAAG